MHRHYFLIAIFAAFIFLSGASSAFAATIYANYSTGSDTTGDGSSGNPYKTFNKAYTAASSGDTINLAGTFDWTNSDETGDAATTGYTIGKSLTIIGQSASSTIIQAAGSANTASARVFTISSNVNVTFQDLTIRYGYITSGSGAAINDTGGGSLTLRDVVISSDNGSGSFVSGGVYSGGNTTIDRTLFSNNSGGYYDALYIGGSAGNATTTITNSTFFNNTGANYGGIYDNGQNLVITNSLIAQSQDVWIQGSGAFDVKNSIIIRGSSGDALYYYNYSGAGKDNGDNIVGSETGSGSPGYPFFTNGVNGTNKVANGTTLSNLNIATSLADNSSLNGVQTLALQSGSSAINGGATGTNHGVSVPAVDGRDLYRDSVPDIGPYEYNATANLPVLTSITAPVASEATSSTMTLAATASGGAGIAGVTFYIDGMKQGSEITSAPYSMTFDTTATSSGSHSVFAVARDASNAYATSTSVSFTVDNVAPTVSLSAPVSSEATSSTMTLAASASDNSAVAGVTFYINGMKVGSEVTSAPYSRAFDTTATSSGSYTALAVARDTSNNYATSTGVTFTIDNTPPTVSITVPSSNESTSSTVTLAANASDANTSVAGVKFYVDGALQGSEVTSAPYSLDWDSTATSSGSHSVFAVARDIVGNRATSTSVTFTVVNTAATPTLVSATPNSSGATITWTTAAAASSRVWFGLTSSYSTSTSENDLSPRVTSHAVTLSGLPSCTQFHYAVSGRNSVLDAATSSDATFRTTGCTGNASVLATGNGYIATSNGGTLTQGNLTMTVPDSFTATSSSATFQANQLDDTAFISAAGKPAGMTQVGTSVFNLKALVDASTTLSTFISPITVTLSYAPADVAGVDESTLKIYRYDGSIWTALSNCSVDTGARTVSCQTSNFSDFSIFGQAIAAQVSDPAPSGGGVVLGCTDKNALNYSPYAFGTDTSSCQYGPALALATSSAVQEAITPYRFTRNLKRGSAGADVKELQEFLNAHGFLVATAGPGSPGMETDYFGPLTQQAVAAFQSSNKIAPAAGYFGPITRALIGTIQDSNQN